MHANSRTINSGVHGFCTSVQAQAVIKQCCAAALLDRLRALLCYMDKDLAVVDSSKALYVYMALHKTRFII